MRATTSRFAVLLAGLAVLTGCTGTGAPDHWLPEAADAMRDPYGSWITVNFMKGYQPESVGGELLCVGTDSLYVLDVYSPTGHYVRAFPTGAVRRARVAHFDPQTGTASGWVAMGSISTLSHGLAAGISLPVWLAFGSAMAGSHSRTALADYPRHPWTELRMYARFPQGPPPRLYRLGLQPKPGRFEVTDTPELPTDQIDTDEYPY